jgi:hypothetical protein
VVRLQRSGDGRQAGQPVPAPLPLLATALRARQDSPAKLQATPPGTSGRPAGPAGTAAALAGRKGEAACLVRPHQRHLPAASGHGDRRGHRHTGSTHPPTIARHCAPTPPGRKCVREPPFWSVLTALLRRLRSA